MARELELGHFRDRSSRTLPDEDAHMVTDALTAAVADCQAWELVDGAAEAFIIDAMPLIAGIVLYVPSLRSHILHLNLVERDG